MQEQYRILANLSYDKNLSKTMFVSLTQRAMPAPTYADYNSQQWSSRREIVNIALSLSSLPHALDGQQFLPGQGLRELVMCTYGGLMKK